MSRRGDWAGCLRKCAGLIGRLVTECIVVVLSVLVLLSGGRTLVRCAVSTAPLALGGLISSRPRLLVVVTLSVWCVCGRLCMLVRLGVSV